MVYFGAHVRGFECILGKNFLRALGDGDVALFFLLCWGLLHKRRTCAVWVGSPCLGPVFFFWCWGFPRCVSISISGTKKANDTRPGSGRATARCRIMGIVEDCVDLGPASITWLKYVLEF